LTHQALDVTDAISGPSEHPKDIHTPRDRHDSGYSEVKYTLSNEPAITEASQTSQQNLLDEIHPSWLPSWYKASTRHPPPSSCHDTTACQPQFWIYFYSSPGAVFR